MDLKKKSQTMDMTKGSPTSLLLRFAMPLFLGNLLQQFYNLVDTSIAGNLLGDGALAQIGATAALYSLITNFAFGMNNGLALGVSRNFGAGDQQGVKKSVCWMTCLSCFCSVVLTVAFLIFRKGLLQVMHHSLSLALIVVIRNLSVKNTVVACFLDISCNGKNHPQRIV